MIRNSASTTRQSFVNDQELCIPWPTLYIIFSFLEHKTGSKKDVHTGNLGSGSNLRKLLMQMLRQLLLFTSEFPEKPGRLGNSGIWWDLFFTVSGCFMLSHKVTYQISLSISRSICHAYWLPTNRTIHLSEPRRKAWPMALSETCPKSLPEVATSSIKMGSWNRNDDTCHM